MSTDGQPPRDDLDDNTVEPGDPHAPETGSEPAPPESAGQADDQTEPPPTDAAAEPGDDEPSSPPPEPFEDPTGEKFTQPAASDSGDSDPATEPTDEPTTEPTDEPGRTPASTAESDEPGASTETNGESDVVSPPADSAEPATTAEPEIPDGSAPETPEGETPAGAEPSTDSSSEETPSTAASYYDDPYDEESEYGHEAEESSETKALAKAGSAAPPPPPPPGDDDDWDSDEEGMVRMSFLEHLEELRKRIIQSAIGLVVTYLACLIFAKDLFAWVRGPIQRSFEILNELHGFDPPLYLVAITPQEQFHLIYLKVPLLGAVFVAAPWLVYQAWSFIAPGLYQRERRWAKPFIFCIAGLFILGGLFGYFVVLKFALTFLLGIGIDSDIRPMISVSSYFSTFVLIELGLGVVFQMPVLIFFLTLLRIVDPTFLLSNVRYAVLIIFIIAAVVTPTPDVFNMILFAAPMMVLFYVGVGASFLLVMKRERGKIPWFRITLVALLILAAVAAGVLYFMHSQLGYNFTNQFPWIVPPPE